MILKQLLIASQSQLRLIEYYSTEHSLKKPESDLQLMISNVFYYLTVFLQDFDHGENIKRHPGLVRGHSHGFFTSVSAEL